MQYKNISDKQEIIDKVEANQQNSGLTVALILLFCVISALGYYLSLAFGTRKYLTMSLKEVLD